MNRHRLWIRTLSGLFLCSALVGLTQGRQDDNDEKIKKAKEALAKEKEDRQKAIQSRIDAADKMNASTVLSNTAKPEVDDYMRGSGRGGGGGGGGGWGGYGGGWGLGLGGLGQGATLQGQASLLNAQANFGFVEQQAMLGQQQVKRAQIQNKQASFNENLYELSQMPEVYAARREQKESKRDNDRLEKLNKAGALQQDEMYLVHNGSALNTLLDQVTTLQSRFDIKGPNIPLSPEVVKHLNLTTINSVNGAGPLRDPRKLSWPIPLRTKDFAEFRTPIEKMAPEVVSQSVSGNIDGDSYNNFMGSIYKFQDALKDQVEDMRPGDYILAKRYLSDLEDASKSLAEPSNAKLFMSPANNPNINSVGALISVMSSGGMRFGAGTTADYTAYEAFYQQFRAYEDQLSRSVGAK